MPISRFRISSLQNEEWFRFHTEFFTLAIACGLDILDVFHIFPLYEPLYKEADQQLEVIRRSFHTPSTTEFGKLRKELFRSVRDTTKSLLRSLDPAEQSAATKVYAAIEKYSDSILNGSAPAQTAASDNLLQDLTSSQGSDAHLAAEVQLLGLGKWVESLQTTNDKYKEALAKRTEESISHPKAGRLVELRREMDHYYIRMIEVVETRLLTIPDNTGGAPGEEPGTPGGGGGSGPVEEQIPLAQELTPDEKILHFAIQLNTCIARYHALLKGRQTRKQHLSSEEEAEEAEE